MRAWIVALLSAGLLAAPASAKKSEGKEWRRRGGLELSESQREKLKAAFRENREALRPLRQREKEELRKLRAQLKEKKAAKELEATLSRLRTLRRSIGAEREKFEEKAASLLTPEQRARMVLRASRAEADEEPRWRKDRRRNSWGYGRSWDN